MITLTNKSAEVTKNTFDYKTILKQALAYFDGDELAATTWINKYAMRDREGNYVESSPDSMHKRMAKEFARIEEQYQSTNNVNGAKSTLSTYGQKRKPLTEQRIYNFFKNFKYVIPQGSVMAGLGNPHILASLSNCVVMPAIPDSYGGIFNTDQQLAQLYKRRCGVGVDISTLRPSQSPVSNAAGTTTGAASFMERFSNTTREVAQNGRRGALMITMDIAHPDIDSFIHAKQDLTKVTGANISVRISDEFMKAVQEDDNFTLRWPIDAEKPKYVKHIRARSLWNSVVKCAHNTAEPGIIFWDRQHKYSTSSVYPGFKNVSTNPCSEIAMQGGDSCRLIALNLYSFVDQPFTPEAKFNSDKFYEITYESQRLMDDLVDLELEAIGRILNKINSDTEAEDIKRVERETWELLYESGKKGRRTGLGFTGLADTLAALGLKFDSQDSIETIEDMMKVKCMAEFDSSIDMAIEREKFEAFDPEIEHESDFVKMMMDEMPEVYERMMKYGRRNISISTAAPTGSISMLAQTSSGIEPVFMTSYTRRRKISSETTKKVDFVDDHGDKWEEFTVFHPKLTTWMDTTGETDISKSPYQGSTASEIDWLKRIEIQSTIQKYITHSISSTINLPAEATIEKVGQIYMEAWEQGLKGITVYRDGSRNGVLIADKDRQSTCSTEITETKAPVRPVKLTAEVIRFLNNDEKWIAVVGLLNGKPYEVFTGKAEDSFYLPNWVDKGWVIKNKDNDKSRYDFQFMDKDGYRVTIEGLSRSFDKEYWNYAKLISGILRHGMPLPYVVELVGNLNLYDDSINNWKNGVERALKKFIPNGSSAADRMCASCGDPEGLVYEEGCLKCVSCGNSKCG
ncbi:adenosylcobalamin-dependent ribonucleoside-diphosphate reductase [Roseivirga echinicomitans]